MDTSGRPLHLTAGQRAVGLIACLAEMVGRARAVGLAASIGVFLGAEPTARWGEDGAHHNGGCSTQSRLVALPPSRSGVCSPSVVPATTKAPGHLGYPQPRA